MNKAEALNRLSSLENEAKALRTIIEAPEKPKTILDRVISVKDACNELRREFDDIYDDCKDDYDRAEVDVKIFAEALREGKPASECMHHPYFYRGSSGGGFSVNVVDSYYYGACTYVGARLRVDTPEKAMHLGRCMESSYKIYLTGK